MEVSGIMAEDKKEEKKEKWLNYLALTTVIFAVCATLATFRAGGNSTKSVLAQSKASDQWAYFQSKSIKGYLYELQKEEYALAVRAMGPKANRELAADYAKRIENYGKKIEKYTEEKTQIEQAARTLELERDNAQKHSQAFGLSVIFLQIAILLSSISALMKKKPLWMLGIASGSIGLIYFANGFFLFLK